NKSVYNKKAKAKESFFELLASFKAKYMLISFNNEGFISNDDFCDFLQKIGKVNIVEQKYNTYRASRNLNRRNLHTTEYLYIVKKG
ncbi:MAG: DNA modification methylase, partial [Campylobacter sp.]|nr:DNA modification methylase [Campylobacter sp.]